MISSKKAKWTNNPKIRTKCPSGYNQFFDGAKKIVIIPDAYIVGYHHAINIISKLQPFVENICYSIFEDIPKPKFDCCDIIEYLRKRILNLFYTKFIECRTKKTRIRRAKIENQLNKYKSKYWRERKVEDKNYLTL